VVDTPLVDAATLRDLRRQRRRNRLRDLDWFEAAYRAYLTAIVGIVVVLLVSSFLGDNRPSPKGLADLHSHGPAALGLLAALGIALGLRSGSHGGPLAVEPAEVRYTLLAPVDRRVALRSAAYRQLRFAVFLGAVVGAIGGVLAYRRLSGHVIAWAASGTGAGAAIAAGMIGSAMVASGLRLRRWMATLLGAAVLAWAVADLVGKVPAPTTTLGSLALWPLRIHWIDLLGVIGVAVICVAGIALLGRVSLEALERRTGLVGQLRFAVTVQDLRTVIVLRRQLAQDRPRNRPWLTLSHLRRFPVWRRGWHGVLRFPAPRLARLLLLTGVTTVCLIAAYRGTTPLVLIAALAVYLAGLDAIEPLSQEIDQSDRADALPVDRGDLLMRQLAVPGAVMFVLAVIGAAIAIAIDHSNTGVALAAILALPAAWCGAAGASVSVVMGAPEPFKDGQLLPPEVAGMKIALRTAWPLIVALAGCLPVVAARRAHVNGNSPIPAAAQAGVAALLVAGFTVAWVRFREPAHVWWKQFMAEGQQAAKDRQALKRGSTTR
jgi:hypothetical protein